MPEHTSAKRHPKIAFTTTVIIPQIGYEEMRAIKVEVDEEIVDLLGDGTGKDRDLIKAYAENRANYFVQFHRLFGLSLAGTQKITVTKSKPSGAKELFTINRELFEQLQSSSSRGGAKIVPELRIVFGPHYMCVED